MTLEKTFVLVLPPASCFVIVFVQSQKILCALCWRKMAPLLDDETELFLFVSAHRMKSLPAKRSWALRSSSTGPLPDDDSKHGWVVLESRSPCSAYIQELAQLGTKHKHTHLSHILWQEQCREKNNTCTRAGKCEEAVNSSRWLVFVHCYKKCCLTGFNSLCSYGKLHSTQVTHSNTEFIQDSRVAFI